MANKLSSKFVDRSNGVEYYETYFTVRSQRELTMQEYAELNLHINQLLKKINDSNSVPSNNSNT